MRLYRLIAGLTGWFALILQYVLMVQGGWTLFATVNFLSYFTILSNLLAALALTLPLFMPSAFHSASLRTAVALYMAVTGLIYSTVLQGLWAPQGWAFVADALLHYVMPALYLVDWAFFADKRELRYRDVPRWLVFPALYAVYSLLRGSLADWYPYPFLDAGKLRYETVAINAALVVTLFAGLAFALVWIGQRLPWGAKNTQS